MKELLLLEQVNQWLCVLGDTYGMEVASLSNHSILRTCMTDLEWYQTKTKTVFLELTAATSFTQHMLHEWDMKLMLPDVSNTSWMFNTNHGGDKMLLMGSTTTHRNFHITGLPPSCEHDDSIGQTKRM